MELECLHHACTICLHLSLWHAEWHRESIISLLYSLSERKKKISVKTKDMRMWQLYCMLRHFNSAHNLSLSNWIYYSRIIYRIFLYMRRVFAVVWEIRRSEYRPADNEIRPMLLYHTASVSMVNSHVGSKINFLPYLPMADEFEHFYLLWNCILHYFSDLHQGPHF